MSDYQRCCQCLAVIFTTHPAYPHLCDDCGWQEARLMERVRSAGDGALEFSVLCGRVMNGEQTPERRRWEVR